MTVNVAAEGQDAVASTHLGPGAAAEAHHPHPRFTHWGQVEALAQRAAGQAAGVKAYVAVLVLQAPLEAAVLEPSTHSASRHRKGIMGHFKWNLNRDFKFKLNFSSWYRLPSDWGTTRLGAPM